MQMKRKRNKAGNRHQRLQVITLCISTAVVLILLGMVALTVFTGINLSAYVKENLTVTMVLSPETSEPEAQRLSQTVQSLPYISGVHYVSKDEALKEGTTELGADPTEFAGENPFTAEIELQLKADYANNDSIKWIAGKLKAYEGVTDVDYKQDLIDTVNKTLSKIGLVLIVLACLLTVVSFSLINNTIRLSVFSRRFSIHTMKLVGASWGFIRRPFIKRAFVLGLLSAFIALLVLAVGMYALHSYEPDIMTVIDVRAMLFTAIIVVFLGVFITLICAHFSVNKFLRMKAGDLYKI